MQSLTQNKIMVSPHPKQTIIVARIVGRGVTLLAVEWRLAVGGAIASCDWRWLGLLRVTAAQSLIVDNATAHRGQWPGVLGISAACRVWVGAVTACRGWLYHDIRGSVNLTPNNKIIEK